MASLSLLPISNMPFRVLSYCPICALYISIRVLNSFSSWRLVVWLLLPIASEFSS